MIINPSPSIAVQDSAASKVSQGTVVFSNSNSMSFGLNGSTMTGSFSQSTHDHPYMATGERNNYFFTSANTFANSTHSHGNPTLALTNLTGTTASASNGFTLSLSAGAPGAGGGFAAQGSGTYTQNTGTIQWANSNSITFGLTNNQMTASFSQSVQPVAASASNGSYNFSTIKFVEGSGVTWATQAGGIQASVQTNYVPGGDTTKFAGVGETTATTAGTDLKMTVDTAGVNISYPKWITTYAAQSVQPVAASGSNGSFNFSTLQFVTGNGATFYTDATGIRLTYTVPTQTVESQSFGLSNLATAGGGTGGTSGVASGGQVRYLFAAGSNITLSQSVNGASGTMTIYAPAAGGGDAIRGVVVGASTATTNSVNFSNSNNVSFGFGAGGNSTVITASASYTSTNPAASASNGSFSFQTLNFSNANNVTFGTSAGGIVTASVAAPGGGAGVNRQWFEIMDGERLTTCAILNNATFSNRVIFCPFVMKEGGTLSVRTVRVLASRTGGTVLVATMGVGFYTFANSTSINLLFSTTHNFSVQSSVSWSGVRAFDFTNMGANTLTAGEYVFGFYNSAAASNSIGLNLMGGDNLALAGYVLTGTNQTAATASNSYVAPFWGVWNATTAAFPAAVALSSVSGGNPGANSPDIYAIIKEI